MGRVFAAAIMAVASLASSALAADESDFCKQYRAIAADAPHGFASFRGEQTKQEKSTVEPYDLINTYSATGWPDGALNCHIEMRDEPTSDGHRYPNYYCEFAMLAADKGKALRRMASRIAACVRGASRPSGPGLEKEGGMLTWHARDRGVHYSAFAGPSNPNIRILIQSERR